MRALNAFLGLLVRLGALAIIAVAFYFGAIWGVYGTADPCEAMRTKIQREDGTTLTIPSDAIRGTDKLTCAALIFRATGSWPNELRSRRAIQEEREVWMDESTS